MSTITLRSVKGSGLTNNEIDANFTNLNTDKVEAAQTATLTNKTLALSSNTISGTLAQFNTALTDGDFATLAGTETLTNKTLTNPSYSGATANGGTVTTIDINGGTIDDTVIGGSSAAAGSFTTVSASGAASVGGAAAALNTFTINQSSTYAETLTNGSQAYAWRLDGTSLKLSDRTAFTEKLEVSSTGLAVTGALSATTTATAASFIPSGATVPTNGMYLPSANTLAWSTNSAIKATLDASGNLGLGVTPSAWLSNRQAVEVGGAVSVIGGASITQFANNYSVDGSAVERYKVTGAAAQYMLFPQAGGVSWYTAPSGTAGNAITFTQAMTLNASGNLLLGTTSTSVASGGIVGYGLANGQFAIGHAAGVASGDNYAGFQYNGTGIGSITQSGTTAVLYNTTSDARLKENITDANDAASLIDALQVRQFDWKSDGSHQRYGFVAQELYEVAPEAVCKPQDPDEMMAVDYSKLVPMLVKEIQSLRQRVAQLEGI